MTTAYEQISNLIARYSFLTDGNELAEFGKLMRHATLSFTGGVTVRGAQAIADAARDGIQTHEDGTSRSRHSISNLYIDVDEQAGTATARSYFTVLQALPDFPLQPIAAGQYHDRFAIIDGEWQFTERVSTLDLAGDLSRFMRVTA